MTLTRDHVRRLAHLARIELTGGEAGDVQRKLESILGLISELESIDTTGVEPMSHAHDVTLPLREDVVTEADHHAEHQRIAPATEDGLYLVPKVIE